MFKNNTIYSLILLLFSSLLWADEPVEEIISNEQAVILSTVETLKSILEIQGDIQKRINSNKTRLQRAMSSSKKEQIQKEITALENELLSTNENFDKLSTNSKLTLLREGGKKKFNLEEEIVSLLKPAIEEMNLMTEDVRKKSQLREDVAEYKNKLTYISQTTSYIKKLLPFSQKKSPLNQSLIKRLDYLESQQELIQSQYKTASIQLEKLTVSKYTLRESIGMQAKSFFKKRGFYLAQALLVIMMIIFLSRFINRLMKRYIPAFNKQPRSFQIRLIDLVYFIVTLLLLLAGPMVVFYLAEDWVLFSLGIVLLIGLAWTLRRAIPHYWKQINLFLNIGSVREGERIFLDNLPWKVDHINLYTQLVNPVAGIKQRVPIKDLVDMRSRPYNPTEPWFPCKHGDWVSLADGCRGKVIGISNELVKLIQLGGAHRTYLTTEFLGLSPINLSVNFRITETFGISYNLQPESTENIPKLLKTYLLKKLIDEGFRENLLNLEVEFKVANNSSLDMVVLADFKGNSSNVYEYLTRAIQRWCVEASTKYDWEIPFPQLTLHSDSLVPQQDVV